MMTNEEYIDCYSGDDKIIYDYYKCKDTYNKLSKMVGIVTPLHIDNRQYMSPTDNQKNTPHCAAYSAATLIESLYWKKTGKLIQLDSHQIYALAKQLDGMMYSEGTYLEIAIKAVLQLCLKDSMFSFLKNAKVGVVYNDKSMQTVDRVKDLIHRYDFIQAGFNIDEGWYDCDNQNYILKQKGCCYGGHAVNICGYDEIGFYILNQWGTDFGSKGYCIIPYELFLKEFLYCAYIYDYMI